MEEKQRERLMGPLTAELLATEKFQKREPLSLGVCPMLTSSGSSE